MDIKESKKRYYILDIIRGITLVSMIAYHFMFDLYAFGIISSKAFFSEPMQIWQQSICMTFIFLSGFCFHLGRKQWKRGLIILGFATILSVGTFFAEIIAPGSFISFGILCFMASAIFITIPLDLLFKRVKYIHWVGFFVCLITYILIKDLHEGELLLGSVSINDISYNPFYEYVGLPTGVYTSSDYFPILPWIFLYLTGYFAYGIFKQFNLLKIFTKFRIKPLEFIGRHTLIFYMAHQIVLYPIAFIIAIILGVF